MKQFEADQKRLKGILLNYKDKKTDLSEKEVKEREDIIEDLKETFRMFNIQFQEQNLPFDNGFSDLRENTSINDNYTINELGDDFVKGEIIKSA